MGRPITHLSHHLVDVDPVAVVRQVAETGEPYEREVLTRDDCWYLMRVLPYRVGPAVTSGTVLTFFDVSRLKKREQELLRSQRKIRSILRTVPVGVGLVTDRVIQEANDTLCAMTGYRAEELIGQSSRMLYPTDEDYEAVGRDKYEQIRNRGMGTVITRWRRKSGEVFPVMLSSAPLDTEDWSQGVTFTAWEIPDGNAADGPEIRQKPKDTPYGKE